MAREYEDARSSIFAAKYKKYKYKYNYKYKYKHEYKKTRC